MCSLARHLVFTVLLSTQDNKILTTNCQGNLGGGGGMELTGYGLITIRGEKKYSQLPHGIEAIEKLFRLAERQMARVQTINIKDLRQVQ